MGFILIGIALLFAAYAVALHRGKRRADLIRRRWLGYQQEYLDMQERWNARHG